MVSPRTVWSLSTAADPNCGVVGFMVRRYDAVSARLVLTSAPFLQTEPACQSTTQSAKSGSVSFRGLAPTARVI